ncbi:hypothetical protein ACSV5S_18145 [Agrobacterium deltaense]|uniref:hypothetical protein n=1 Tax=Agrobacterium deltaense TaxID=1183412 RepID=UPI003D95F340
MIDRAMAAFAATDGDNRSIGSAERSYEIREFLWFRGEIGVVLVGDTQDISRKIDRSEMVLGRMSEKDN